MSLLYSILKPIVRRVVKGSSLHQEESYEAFKRASYAVQRKFKFTLPRVRGFELREETLDGFVWLWAEAFYAHRQRKWVRLLRQERHS